MNGEDTPDVPTDRESPIGAPVIRGDATISGNHAAKARAFDPHDPESVETAVEMVRSFAAGEGDPGDPLVMLEGAAACAALVLGEGSYKAATERAGAEVSVSFIRKWARVHDLPHSIRRLVARGRIAPTAAKHIARVQGEGRYLLAWATTDHDLSVREVRSIASEVNEGRSMESTLAEHGVSPGEFTIHLPVELYRDVRREAAMRDVAPDEIITEALANWFD